MSEETIELRELMYIILKGKWIVIGITIFSILISGILSFFVIKPIYQVETTISINNKALSGLAVSSTESYFAEQVTPTFVMERIKSKTLVQMTIDKSNTGITKEIFLSNLSIENIPSTNILRISLKNNNQETIVKLLDAHILNVKESIFEDIYHRLENDITFSNSQATVEKAKLEDLLKTYRKIAAELNLPNTLLLDAAIDYNNQYIMNFDTDSSAIKNIEAKYLIQLNETTSEINSTTSVYRDYVQRSRELEAFASVFNVDDKIVTISPANMPEEPISPNKFLNIAIAMVIGVLLGVGIVIFKNYWNESLIRASK